MSSPLQRRDSSDTTLDPWNTAPRANPMASVNDEQQPEPTSSTNEALGYHIPSSRTKGDDFGEDFQAQYEGSQIGLKRETVSVTEGEGLVGFILKHRVWIIEAQGRSVHRRYAEFVGLLAVLAGRYPFRMLPALPGKRLAVNGQYLADNSFIQKRRQGLQRFLTFLLNHPVLSKDGVLHAFVTEVDFTTWRSEHPISLEEESSNTLLSPSQIQTIPEDLDVKMKSLKARLPKMIDYWTRIVVVYERILRRRLNESIDFAKLQESFTSVLEVEMSGWRMNHVEEVEREEANFGKHGEQHARIMEQRASIELETSLDQLKRHRELYTIFRDLFHRGATLSADSVDKLRKRVDTSMKRVDTIRSSPATKTSDATIETLSSSIEADNRTIETLLQRRVFIRYCLWNEMLFLFQSTALLTVNLHEIVRAEQELGEQVSKNWSGFTLSSA